jgi:NADH dehydrogenase
VPTHRLVAEQTIPGRLEDVFAFFATPQNLGRLTPAEMGFTLRSEDLAMREGLVIDYRVRPLLGVPVRWRSRIESYAPPHRFVDVQTVGPYRSWVHHHAFAADGEATRVIDEIAYALPFGPIGSAVHAAVVRRELEHVFRIRAQALSAIFAQPAPNPSRMTVAVAGGTGFVGGAIAAELFRRGHRVVVLSHRGEAARGWLPDAVEIRNVDAAAGERLDEALAGVDGLVIALAFPNSPIEAPRRGLTFEAVDAAGTEHLTAAAQRAGVGRILYLSGAGAGPNATRHWFRAKWRAEEAVRGAGPTWTILRPTWIFGPRDVALNRFLRYGRQLLAVPMSSFGRQPLAPVYVDDVARLAADSLVDPAAADQVFEVGGPETLSMRAIIRTALEVAELRRPVVPVPTPLLKVASIPLTFLPTPPLTPDALEFINQPATVDNGPLLARMPRRLTPLREGLARYLAPDAGPGTRRFAEGSGAGR